MRWNAGVYPAFVEMLTLLASPREILARPGVVDRINEVAGRQPSAPPGSSRAEVLAMLS